MIQTMLPAPDLAASTSSPHIPLPTIIPPVGEDWQEIHLTGQRTLWVVTVLMGISALVFYGLSARRPLPKRVSHILASLVATISFIIYLALATGQGITWKRDVIIHPHKSLPDTSTEFFRQVAWLRYVNWLLTEPLILANVALLSGLPGAHLLIGIFANYVMLASGLFGTFAGHTRTRWVWFTISVLGYLTLIYHIGVLGTRAATNKDARTRRFHSTYVGVALLVKILYPIGIAAGALALRLSLDGETILWAIYDIFAQGLLGYWIVLAQNSISETASYFDGFWSRGAGGEGSIRIDEDGA